MKTDSVPLSVLTKLQLKLLYSKTMEDSVFIKTSYLPAND